MTTSVFISYSRRNQYIAQRLYDDLRRTGCQDPWFDQGSIPVNDEWEPTIEKGVLSRDAFVYLWSPEAGESKHVQQEYELAQRHHRKIAVVLVAGTREDMPPEVSKLQFIDLTKNYETGVQNIINWLGNSEPVENPVDLIKSASPLRDALAALQIAKPQTWFVQDPNRSPAERRRSFVKFPILPSGYSTSWLVTDTQKDLELQPDLHFVLKFTDDGYRDSVQEVLDYLVANAVQPQVLFVEGPKNEDGRYILPDDTPRVWADAVELVSRLIRISGGSRTLHFFLHAPQALSFAVASTFTPFQKYHVYNLDRDQPLGQRYKCVFSKTSGH